MLKRRFTTSLSIRLGLLEIAVREGYAAQMYNLSVGSNIMVNFHDNDKILR